MLSCVQHVDCVILDDGGFLLMSNQDEYISLVSNNQPFSSAYRYHGCQNICSHIFRLRQIEIYYFSLALYIPSPALLPSILQRGQQKGF